MTLCMDALPDRNTDYEGTLIGAITMWGAQAFEAIIAGGIQPDHFTDPLARKAFIVATEMAHNGINIGTHDLIVEMRRRNLLDGEDLVRMLRFDQYFVGVKDLTIYISAVVELARKRKLMMVAYVVANGDFDAVDELREALDELEPGAARTSSPLTWKVRRYIEEATGVFANFQIYADLGITDAKEKTKVRVVLNRFNGSLIEPDGGRAGTWRKIKNDLNEMDFKNVQDNEVSLWLPLDLHDCAVIHPGNIIVVTGDPNAGKTAFLLSTIRENLLKGWKVHYFNSEMGVYELRKRLELFEDFPMNYLENGRFHAYERSADFHDVIQPGEGTLNIIDYLEASDEFYKMGGYLTKIHTKLSGALAIVAIQKRDKHTDMPLGAQRALEKPRLAVALKSGRPNEAVILKCKNRRTSYSLDGYKREFKLINGSEFRAECPDWHE